MKHTAIIKETDPHLPSAGPGQQLTANAVLQQLHSDPFLTADLIAHRNQAVNRDHIGVITLYENMNHRFILQEVKEICFTLPDVDFENLAGSAKSEKLQELIRFMNRQERLPELIAACKKHNRAVQSWTPPPNAVDAVKQTFDLAIIVDISRPILSDVGGYLDHRPIEANLLRISATGGRSISPDISWDPFFNSFSAIMNRVKSDLGSPDLHFFLSAPGPLIFGFGSIMGTVDDVVAYHYEKGSYFPIEVKRSNRSGR